MRIGKSRLNLTAGIRLSKNIFFGDGISGALEGRGIFGTSSQALAISPQLAQAAGTFGTTSAAQLPYLAQGANTFAADHSATASSFTGLLDEYPGAAAAYSVRLLSSTYSGALVRIRRANDNSEEDFYPDSNNELSLNSETSGGTSLSSWISSENGFIVTWYDQSVNSLNATNVTANEQPQLLTTGALITENGKPALSFNGTTNNLNTSGYMVQLSTNNASVYTVINAVSSPYILAEADNIPYSSQFILGGDVNNQEVLWVNTTEFGSGFIGSQKLIGFIYNGSTFQAYQNNATDGASGAATINSEVSNTTYIGSRADGTTSFYDGKIQEIIVYKADKTADNSGINTNINDYFNIYV